MKKKKVTINPRLKIDGKASESRHLKERQKIILLRGKGKTWDEIAQDVKLSVPTVKKLYQDEMALSLTVSKKHGNHFKEHIKAMDNRFNEIVETMDRLHDLAKKTLDNIEKEDIDDIRTYLKFIRTVPAIVQIVREIKDQIAFLREEQGKITLEMKKSMPTLSDLNKHLNVALTRLHREGYIKIIKPLDLDK